VVLGVYITTTERKNEKDHSEDIGTSKNANFVDLIKKFIKIPKSTYFVH
jgi:hypothetical protein